MLFDEEKQKVTYYASVKNKGYLAIGYGTSMTDTNIVIFMADGESSAQTDTWSSGYGPPADIQNIYDSTFNFDQDTGYVNFTSTRDLEPPVAANSQDFVI